jgi:hypothetical protein
MDVLYNCSEKEECIYKGIDNLCEFMSDKPDYYNYHLGEVPETTCKNPYDSVIRKEWN